MSSTSTSTLSSESAFSIKKPASYAPASALPISASTTSPKATPTTIHQALQPAARHSDTWS